MAFSLCRVIFLCVEYYVHGGESMNNIPYNRNRAAAYARWWALERNPAYFDFQGIGGDCTNFVSQCLYAGSGVMNYTPEYGWFYRTANDRTPSWTGVPFLYQFLTENLSVGPFGHGCVITQLQIGDVVQLGDDRGEFYHSLFVLHGYPNIRVAAHTGDALDRPLNSYAYNSIRCVHIDGVRTW